MIETSIKAGRTLAKLEDLKLWDKNPRSIKEERYEELKARLQKYGLLQPLLVNQDGMVIGGNHRVRALREIGETEVWVNQVITKSDQEVFKLALTDNEEFAYYEPEQVAKLAYELGLNMDELTGFAVQKLEPIGLGNMVTEFGPEGDEPKAKGKDPSLVTCPNCGTEFKPESKGE